MTKFFERKRNHRGIRNKKLGKVKKFKAEVVWRFLRKGSDWPETNTFAHRIVHCVYTEAKAKDFQSKSFTTLTLFDFKGEEKIIFDRIHGH